MSVTLIKADLAYSTDTDAALRQILLTGYVALDLETSPRPEYRHLDTAALHPCTGQIAMVILESGGEVYLFREVPSWLDMIIEDPGTTKIIHNAKFDLCYLFAATGISYARSVADTYLKEMLVSARDRGQSHSLQASLKRRLGIDIDKGKTEDDSGVPFAVRVDWTGEWTEEMVDYALGDIHHLAPLNAELDRLLESTGQTRAARIECDAVSAIAAMTLKGFGLDESAWRSAIQEWEGESIAAVERLNTELPGVVNWNSRNQIIAAVKEKHGVVLPNTQKATLADMQSEVPELKHLLDYKKYEKRLGNWGDGFFDKFVCAACSRVHPSWWQMGADTGRMSCSSPNLQQIPREPSFRALFHAEPSHVLVSVDLQQIEIVCAAITAGDPDLLAILRKGGDTHREVGSILLGKAPADLTKDERQLAKIANIGLLFGGGAGGLIGFAHTSYGVEMSEAQAKLIIIEYFAAFPALKQLRSAAYREVDAAKAAGRFLIVRNLVGMRRILSTEKGSLKPTTYLNTMIQSTAAYALKAGLRRFGEAGLNGYLCAVVHDEAVFEFPIEQSDALAAKARVAMIEGVLSVLGRDAPVEVDVEMNESWTSLWTCAECGYNENARKAVLRSPCVKCAAEYQVER